MGTHFELHRLVNAIQMSTHNICLRLVDAIQMSTHNICLCKEVKKKITGCNLKTTEFLDCVLIGVCAVIRLNMVYPFHLNNPISENCFFFVFFFAILK